MLADRFPRPQGRRRDFDPIARLQRRRIFFAAGFCESCVSEGGGWMICNSAGDPVAFGDALLPPRKRLLAGLKRQNSDVNIPTPSTSRSFENECDVRLNSLLRFYLSNSNLSNEEIVEASRSAAIKATEVAEAARAKAEQKAAKAAQAMAAARSALDLVATLSEEVSQKEKCQKKSKTKKHVPVHAFYNRNRKNTNCRADEELARKLHQAINSSPRILKALPGSDTKNQKHKKLKTSASSGRTSIGNAFRLEDGNRPSTATSDVNCLVEIDTEGPVKESNTIMVDLSMSKHGRGDCASLLNEESLPPSKTNKLKSDNGVATPLKNKFYESLDSAGKKRGRTKQKKLPLSICSFRDQSSPNEELKTRNKYSASQRATGNHSSVVASEDSLMPVETTSWKCQAFRAPACVTQNKVMQS